MDRLLSKQDCQRIFQEIYGKEEAEIEAIHTFIEAIAKAQLAKTDKEWVESMPIMWDKCWTKTCIYMTPDCDFLGNACMAWQSRRKEIGL